MVHIVALLKKNDWVKMKTILKRMDETEFESGPYLGCVNRTIQRDIKTLQKEYHAHIIYSKSEGAYRLMDRNWTFEIPSMLSADELLALVVGGRVSRDIFPKAIGQRMEKAVDNVLNCNESADFGPKLLNSLKVLTEDASKAVSDDIFQMVFDAWRTRSVLRIRYSDRNGMAESRDVEPHALVFHEMRWSMKCLCRLRNAPRTFLLSRIVSAVELNETFTPRQEIIDSVTPDDFMDFAKTTDVRIWLNEAGRQFAEVYALHSRQSILKNDEGSYTLCVPAVSMERMVPWVLKQQGNARPESPPSAVEAVRCAIRRLADVCQAYDKDEIRRKTREMRRDNQSLC